MDLWPATTLELRTIDNKSAEIVVPEQLKVCLPHKSEKIPFCKTRLSQIDQRESLVCNTAVRHISGSAVAMAVQTDQPLEPLYI